MKMSHQASSSNLEKMAALKESAKNNDYSILVTGATGFIGKKTNRKIIQNRVQSYRDVKNTTSKFR